MDPLLSASWNRAALAAAVLFASSAAAQIFSPGDLARAHEHLEGLRNCKQCHGDGEQVPPSKCLDCHAELNARVRAGEGFHGRMAPAERACESCHHEHHGRGFALIEWIPSKKTFPHDKTGWSLKGAHRKVECDDCHKKRLIEDDAVRAYVARHPAATTYLGLPTRCASCHFDEHRGQTKGACDKCHGAEEWKPAPGFDHSKTEYALTGKHRSVKCVECHPALQDSKTPADAFPAPRARTFLKFGGIAHSSCLDCHEDPHQNRFGPRCSSCHSTSGWREVKTPGGARAFHEKTRYPLRGLHEDVECKACHGPFPGVKAKFKGLPFARCDGCHEDAHVGQLAKKVDCESCHTVSGFVPPRFELADHQKTRYPLEGAHRAVACNACHEKEAALAKKLPAAVKRELAKRRRTPRLSLAVFDVKGDLKKCETCHRDPHAGQFADRRGGCESCHEVASFAKVRFDHGRDSRFPLEGKHAETPCAGCHRAVRVKGAEVVRYKPLDLACDGCHADPHAGQFAGKGGRADCAACHDAVSFEKTRFVHAPPFTKFELDGRHAEVPCVACHAEVALAGGRKARRYVQLPTTCEGCHVDHHQGAFRGFTP